MGMRTGANLMWGVAYRLHGRDEWISDSHQIFEYQQAAGLRDRRKQDYPERDWCVYEIVRIIPES
jgi:hypothetical protein